MATEVIAGQPPELKRWLAFRRLSDGEREVLAGFFRPQSFRQGEILCSLGKALPGLFLVDSGEVALLRSLGGRSTWQRLRPGSMFGSSALVEGARRLGARAQVDSTVWLLPAARYEEACAAVGPLAELLKTRKKLRELEPLALEAMRRSTVLGKLSPRFHRRLIEGGIVVPSAGKPLVREGDPVSALFLVGEGKFKLLRGAEVVRRLGPGDVYGDFSLATDGKFPLTLVPEDALSVAVRIDREVFEALAHRSPDFRRELAAVTVEQTPLLGKLAPAIAGIVQSVLFLADAGIALAPLLDRLARTVRETYGDKVATLTFESLDKPSTVEGDATPVLCAPFGEDDLRRAIGPAPCDYAFLDGSGPRALELLGRNEEFARVIALCHRVVVVTRSPSEREVRRRWPNVPLDRVTFAALVDEMPDHDREHQKRLALPPRTVRLKIDRARLERLAPDSPLSDGERANFERWARAVTNRLVGVALGGGGAFGYAHVALLDGLARAGVPIDMVSGSSFGAVIGSFYCASPRDGMTRVRSKSIREGLTRATWRAFVSMKPIENFIDDSLAGVRLERLEIPFFAVATEIATGLHRAISYGKPGPAVRASGSFPGLFGVTELEGMRLVDGGIADNVPDDVLFGEGAQLVIASNVVPPPLPEEGERARWHRLLLDLPGRAVDAMRSFFIMMHGMGAAEAQAGGAVVFNNPPNDFLPAEFDRADEIIARAEEDVKPTVAEAARRWSRLLGDR